MLTIRKYLNNTEFNNKTLDNYASAIDENTNKENNIIVGHLHHELFIEKSNRKIMILDTFQHNYKYYIIDDILIFADTHITHKTDVNTIIKILDICDKHTGKIVFLGDILDLWIEDPLLTASDSKIKDFIKIINEKDNIYFIKGNHDWDIENYFEINTLETLIIDNYKFYHGHQFDPIFNADIFSKLFWYSQLFIGDNLYKLNKFLKKIFLNK